MNDLFEDSINGLRREMLERKNKIARSLAALHFPGSDYANCHRQLLTVYDKILAAIDEAAILERTKMFPGTYQQRVNDWMLKCFGPSITEDKTERNHRFLEEALELVQSGGCTASEAHQLVDYVFSRPVGEIGQEVGGSIVTLAALCNAHGVDLDAEAEKELTRIWGMVDRIRAKQAAKPKHSPLPE